MKRKLPLVLLLTVCLCAGAWFLLRPKPAPPPVVLHPTPQRLAQAETHIAAIGKAVSAPSSKSDHAPRTLRLSENDLNVYLAGSKSVRKLLAARGVQAVQIVLVEPSNMVIHAAVRINGHLQNIQIDGFLRTDSKQGLRFTASKAQVGRFPLPPPVVTAQATTLASRFLRLLNRRLFVQSVTVQKKDLVIVGLPVTKAFQQSKSPDHR